MTEAQTQHSELVIARSIRFAEPVTGRHRFSDPVYNGASVAESTDERTAARVSPLQEPGDPTHPLALGDRDMTDDVLFVNVWTPSAPSEKPRPIAVYIHGGNLIHGAAGWPVYDGAELAADLDIVVVTIGYRLGIWGWDVELPWSSRTQDGAMLDIAAGLKWIIEHAAELGGDPSNITLMGHSVGAACVMLQAYAGTPGASRKLALFSPPLDPARRDERRGFAVEFGDEHPAAKTLGDDPQQADNLALLEYQNALEAAWRAADGSDDLLGFCRPAVAEGSEYPWERGVAPSDEIPIFSTWTDGEFGDRGPVHRDRLMKLLGTRSNPSDVHTDLSSDEFEGLSVGDTHFLLIPLVFGNDAAWEGTTLSRHLDSPRYLAKRSELRRALSEFIHS